MNREQKIMQCHLCKEHCPQAEMSSEIAHGRMFATKELIACQKELEAYREIGTPQECRDAVEKQKAKKANKQGIVDSNGKFHTWNGINGKPYLLCPNCGTNLCCEMPYDKKPKYCDDCGQKLDWSDEEWED